MATPVIGYITEWNDLRNNLVQYPVDDLMFGSFTAYIPKATQVPATESSTYAPAFRAIFPLSSALVHTR